MKRKEPDWSRLDPGISLKNALPAGSRIRSPVNPVMKNAAINNLGMTPRTLNAVGDPRSMAAGFLPLIVTTFVNPHFCLGAKKKHIRILHTFSITSVPGIS